MAEQNKKTILVTGGAGFIGSCLCEKYLNEGNRVICVDNLQTTFTTDNIDHLLKHKNFKFIRDDIIEPIELGEKIDWIFNFACPAQCISIQFDPVHTLKTCVDGVINMLELAKQEGARIMQASSSEIYGHNPKMPQVETDCGEVNALGPRACYDEGKRIAETLMMDYYRQYGVDIKIIRIFNTYGPRMYIRDGRVMSNFIIAALAGKDLTIYGDGTNTRSFQYIDDLIAGIDKMMKQDKFIGPVNLGNPEEISIKDLADIIIKKTGKKSNIKYAKAVTDDPIRRKPDISLAQEKLDWQPKVTLVEGVEKTIAYFQTVEMPDKKILVFTTTYYPDHGPAESALLELTKVMPNTEFHVVTVKSRRKLSNFEKMNNNYIYRLGSGNILGKYFFPLRGAIKGRQLSRKNKFRFAWSVMASYGGLAATILKMFDKKINFLLTFDKTEIESRGFIKAKLLWPIYKLIFLKADSIHLSDATLEQRAKLLSPGSHISVMADTGKSFIDQVRYTYSYLLNKQEKKLDRPR